MKMSHALMTLKVTTLFAVLQHCSSSRSCYCSHSLSHSLSLPCTHAVSELSWHVTMSDNIAAKKSFL